MTDMEWDQEIDDDQYHLDLPVNTDRIRAPSQYLGSCVGGFFCEIGRADCHYGPVMRTHRFVRSAARMRPDPMNRFWSPECCSFTASALATATDKSVAVASTIAGRAFP